MVWFLLNKMKNKIFLIASCLVVLLFLSGCGCKESDPHQYDLKLEVWGPVDDSSTYQEIFNVYKKTNPNIKDIVYKKIPVDTYKKEVVEALASGQGPDVILIHNTWLPSFSDKVVPASPDILNEQRYRNNFVDVCAKDFLVDGQVWASPLSVDSLGLYYNKDIFNEVGITAPPKDWNEFIEDVKKITIEKNGEIIRSGAALGTAYNINRATDLLSLFFLQGGNEIANSKGDITLNNVSAENALNFYTQFSRIGFPSYSWNPRMHYSIDAFSEGNLAMMINYSWHAQTIHNKSPKLNFAVAPIPQFSGSAPINFANYWAFAVTKTAIPKGKVSNETRIKEAWKLINFLTTKPEQSLALQKGQLGQSVDPNFDPAKAYLNMTGMPAARRDLIELQKNDAQLGVFALGNLVAKSWYQVNPEAVETYFLEMIDQVNKGQITAHEALVNVAQKIKQSIGK